MRFFNTSGPVVQRKHYCVSPPSRMDLDEILQVVSHEESFALHAPRQTGKTTALSALHELLNGGTVGAYRCVYVNIEAGQAMREDAGEAMRAIVGALASHAQVALGDGFVLTVGFEILDRFGPRWALAEILRRWTEAGPRRWHF